MEIRKDCKECGTDIVVARFRNFCGDKCRVKFHNRERKEYQRKWVAEKRKKMKMS